MNFCPHHHPHQVPIFLPQASHPWLLEGGPQAPETMPAMDCPDSCPPPFSIPFTFKVPPTLHLLIEILLLITRITVILSYVIPYKKSLICKLTK